VEGANDAGQRFDAKPSGWKGVRVLRMSDNPANPFANLQQVKAVYTDCGAHAITLCTRTPAAQHLAARS
jgi:hypothetical protein